MAISWADYRHTGLNADCQVAPRFVPGSVISRYGNRSRPPRPTANPRVAHSHRASRAAGPPAPGPPAAGGLPRNRRVRELCPHVLLAWGTGIMRPCDGRSRASRRAVRSGALPHHDGATPKENVNFLQGQGAPPATGHVGHAQRTRIRLARLAESPPRGSKSAQVETSQRISSPAPSEKPNHQPPVSTSVTVLFARPVVLCVAWPPSIRASRDA